MARGMSGVLLSQAQSLNPGRSSDASPRVTLIIQLARTRHARFIFTHIDPGLETPICPGPALASTTG